MNLAEILEKTKELNSGQKAKLAAIASIALSIRMLQSGQLKLDTVGDICQAAFNLHETATELEFAIVSFTCSKEEKLPLELVVSTRGIDLITIMKKQRDILQNLCREFLDLEKAK